MRDPTTDVVLESVRELMEELARGRSTTTLTLDSRLDRDLGLDSLAMVELLARLRERLGVVIPDDALTVVDTPRDLVRVLSASGITELLDGPPPRAGSRLAASAPTTVPTTVPRSTLVDVLDAHASAQPDRVHLRVLGDGRERCLTYGELRDAAAAVGRGLSARHGVEPGETIALMLPTSIDYFVTFLGVLLAGAVPVPIYPSAAVAARGPPSPSCSDPR